MSSHFRKFIACFVLIVALLVVSATADAATYYVDQTAGNDANSGAQAAPWQNCPGMASYTGSGSLVAGDIVYFDRGDTWLLTGTQGLFLVGGVTYIGDTFGTGTRAVLRASSALDAGVVRFRDHATLATIFQGFEVDANHTVSTGIDINHRFSSPMTGATKRVQNNVVHGTSSDQSQGQFKYGIIASSFNSDRTANVEILDNLVFDTSRDAICLYPGDNNAQNQVSNALVRGNESYDTGQDVNYCCGSGFLIKGQVTNAIVEYNYAHDTKGAAVFINSNETLHYGNGVVGLHLRYNILTTVNTNVNGIIRLYDGSGGADTKDLHIYGNLVFNNTTTGGLYIGADAVGAETIRIYNNTFYNAPVFFLASAATFPILEFRNNILSYAGGVPLTDSSGRITAHSNNVYFRGSSTLVSSNGTNFTAANLTTYEATALSTNPQFTNTASVPNGWTGSYGSTLAPNNNGFTLQATSPDINTGFVLADPYTGSINSVSRTAGAQFDRGAYESSSLSPPRPVTGVFVSAPTQQTSSGTPALIQHNAGAMDNNYATSFYSSLPHPALAGNCLIFGIRFTNTGSITSVTDDHSNTWTAGPTTTNTGTAPGTTLRIYYALNVAAGTQKITVTFSGLSSGNFFGNPQAVFSEFYNIAAVSAADGTGVSSNSRTTPNIVTTGVNDLVYQFGVDVSDMDVNLGAQFNGSSIAAGPGFTPLSEDLQTGAMAQFLVKTTAGSVTPTFAASGAGTWASLAIALKSGSGGTPMPSGMRIVHIQHTMIAWPGHTSPVTLQFPSSGNLLVGLFTGTVARIGSISDSAGNTWTSAAFTPGNTLIADTSAQIVYAANATTGPTLSNIATTFSTACSAGDCNLVLYDVAGAATASFDLATTATGNQTVNTDVTMTSITPRTSNGLVFHVSSINFHTITAAVGAGYVLDSMVNAFDDNAAGGTQPSRLDMDNAFGHIANANLNPLTFVYSSTAGTRAPNGISGWGAVAAAFISQGSSTYFTGVTRTAADCSLAAVQAQVTAAADRDTIRIPACAQTNWTSQLNVTKAVAIIGNGQGSTIIGDNVAKTGADTSHLIAFNIPSGKSFVFSNLSIVGVASDSSDWNKGHVHLSGTSTAWRVHHITFSQLKTSAFKIDGCMYGLLDHITVQDGVTHFGGTEVKHGDCGGSNSGDLSWATALDAGGVGNVYIEDSTFTSNDAANQLNVADCLEGGRVVWRFNTLNGANFTSHGTDSGQRERGCRWQEYYNNTIIQPSSKPMDFGHWIRGGSGVVFNETLTATNTVNQLVRGQNCRDASGGCSGGPNYAVWGACNGSGLYDQNSAGQTGYRCVDQPGSGTSLNWNGASTPPTGWAQNISEPFYVWNNTRNGVSYNAVGSTEHVQSGRDYFNNGTPRPGYTAYVYPHPLQASMP